MTSLEKLFEEVCREEIEMEALLGQAKVEAMILELSGEMDRVATESYLDGGESGFRDADQLFEQQTRLKALLVVLKTNPEASAGFNFFVDIEKSKAVLAALNDVESATQTAFTELGNAVLTTSKVKTLQK